jgi:hypothetical protein
MTRANLGWPARLFFLPSHATNRFCNAEINVPNSNDPRKPLRGYRIVNTKCSGRGFVPPQSLPRDVASVGIEATPRDAAPGKEREFELPAAVGPGERDDHRRLVRGRRKGGTVVALASGRDSERLGGGAAVTERSRPGRRARWPMVLLGEPPGDHVGKLANALKAGGSGSVSVLLVAAHAINPNGRRPAWRRTTSATPAAINARILRR